MGKMTSKMKSWRYRVLLIILVFVLASVVFMEKSGLRITFEYSKVRYPKQHDSPLLKARTVSPRNRTANTFARLNIAQQLHRLNVCRKENQTHMPVTTTRGYGPSEGWRVFQNGSGANGHLFSAFYDARTRNPFVKILGIISTTTVEIKMFCQIFFPGAGVPYVVPATLFKMYQFENFSYNGTSYENYRYDCKMKSGFRVIPDYVALTGRKCEKPTHLLPVIGQNTTELPLGFGICLALSYGNRTTIENWVEWFEFYKLLGVAEFNIYNCSLPSSYDRLFNHYTSEGTVRIIQMPAPVKMTQFREGCFLPVELSLNDCLMRNMRRYKFQIYVDVDEFIIPKPRNAGNFRKLIKAINKGHKLRRNAAQYKFSNQYHFLHLSPDTTKSSFLRTMTQRTHFPPNGHPRKYIINPKYCSSTFNHECKSLSQPASVRPTVYVNPKFAVLQHYRSCTKAIIRCDNTSQTINDTNVLRYEPFLAENVSGVLKKLRLTT